MNKQTKQWIEQVLSNDEGSTDKELLHYFTKEGTLTREEAAYWINQRNSYLLKI